MLHKKKDCLPEQVRDCIYPPVPDLIPSGTINASNEDPSTPAYNAPGNSSSDEDDDEEVVTPVAFDAFMVKDAIKRHLQIYSGAGGVVAVHIGVNSQLLRCFKGREHLVEFRSYYIITPRVNLAGSFAPIATMNAGEVHALVQMLERDTDLVCERSATVDGHDHVPLSRVTIAHHERPTIVRHNAEPYGFMHRLHARERMRRVAVNTDIKAHLEGKMNTVKRVDSGDDDESDDGILWMTKSKRSAK
ncbi:hypothetical protein QFC22_003642 [Naganishia vaughanmartiniae]|uniref:Uncharacterized protein n=1 Tax=Naganishia vaughanmartiniae TaxID=1424756 RepID=A0ACC2X674_9TREE|nr:hypothetical protein QFC22_003642 [Naganishia vaughanmartiniae]